MGGVALDNVQMYELAGPEGDTLSGGDGNDTLIGGAGADSLDGGAGTDTADYSDSASGIIADLAAGTGTGGDALGDTYTSIENVTGSDYNDTLTGDANANVLNGGAGNDTLNGGDGSDLFMFQMGGGTDTVNGGAGGGWTDTMLLQDASGGNNLGTYGVDWTITLSEGSITGSDANGFDLSADADGVITLSDGATVNFFDIERIDF
jgi:Ca2+-binding RTX toxin-like protein